jgi:hypothetical protein
MNEPDHALAPPSAGSPPVPTEARDQAVTALSEAFAHDFIDADELERRVTIAQTSESLAEIAKLTADLPNAATATALVPVVSLALLPDGEVRAAGHVVGAAGHARRCEPWAVPRRLTVVNIVGKTTLDFRVAELPVGPVEVVIGSVVGGVTLVVPPGLPIVSNGLAIAGGFDHVERAPRNPEPGAPVLYVRGFAALGSVEVEMRLPGETAGQARRRRMRDEPRD